MRSASPDCSPAYYLIFLVYPFTAAVVVFVRWCWRNSVRTRPLVVLSPAGMFVIQLGGVVYRIRRDPYHREYLPAADFLRARAQPGDLIMGIMGSHELGFTIGFRNNSSSRRSIKGGSIPCF
jgi:hypothetical protein